MAERSTVNRDLVIRALTDPEFRQSLEEEPAKAIGARRLSALKARELRLVLAVVRGIDQQIAGLADELLCANGGPCGIA